MSYYVLVTGASSGIGASVCELLIASGYHVIAGVRTGDDVLRLKTLHGKNIHPLIMDVADEPSLLIAREETSRIIGQYHLVAIINNAGIAVNGAVLYIPVEEWKKQFEVNVFGAIRIIQLFFHLLVRGKDDAHPRRIINISSVSGVFASPFIGPYASSKFALEAISDSLRRELYMYDVDVILIQPGNIMTAIWEKNRNSDSWLGPEYESMHKLKDQMIQRSIDECLPVEVVSAKILELIKKKKVKNRYLIKAGAWKFGLFQLLPDSMVDNIIRSYLRKKAGLNKRTT